jgi:hypothetical protein
MIHPAHVMGALQADERFMPHRPGEEMGGAMEAAARLGVVMAEASQRGFEVFTVHGGGPPLPPFRPPDIRSEVLARLCLVANPERSSILLRVGELRWMGRLLGDWSVPCGCVVVGWTGGPATCVGVWGRWAGRWWRWGWWAMRVVVVVTVEHCIPVGCVDGGRAWSHEGVALCARAWACACVRARVWPRTCKDRRLGCREDA